MVAALCCGCGGPESSVINNLWSIIYDLWKNIGLELDYHGIVMGIYLTIDEEWRVGTMWVSQCCHKPIIWGWFMFVLPFVMILGMLYFWVYPIYLHFNPQHAPGISHLQVNMSLNIYHMDNCSWMSDIWYNVAWQGIGTYDHLSTMPSVVSPTFTSKM